jgi:cyclopropane fatty-acyl-phospholipid synthase-like methyltransferase
MTTEIKSSERLYTLVSEKIGDSPVFFLNHGYSPVYPEFENMPFRHQLSLYKKCIEGIDIENKTVLEVGCGRGGGSKWISDNYNVDMHGCDATPVHVSICKNNEKENLHYKFGRADNLPYETESIDVLISIEASQAFDDLGSFFELAFYKIKEGGKISIMDVYGITERAQLSGMKGLEKYKQLAELWFQDVEIEIVTENVKDACRQDVDLMQQYIENSNVAEFMSQISGESYRRYNNGNRGYFKLTGTRIAENVDFNEDWSTVYKNILNS